MSNPESISEILSKGLTDIDKNLQKKMQQQQVFNNWRNIFGDFADKIMPVKFEGDILFVNSNDNSLKDLLKYSTKTFVDRINERIGHGTTIVTQIKFGRNFNEPVKLPKKNSESKNKSAEVEIKLTTEEIAECEKFVVNIPDERKRQERLNLMIDFAKAKKLKLKRGWHKCGLCDVLCRPEEIICNVCIVKEREKMTKEIRRIFKNSPSTPFREIQQEIIRQFPYLKSECTLAKIDSARMDFISQLAARISYGDIESDEVKLLVMIARQLPEEKLTPAIIKRTLHEFRHDFADQPPFSARDITFRKLKKPAAQTE